MTKLIALVTAGLFAAGTMFAGEHGNCTKQVGNEAKMACTGIVGQSRSDTGAKDKDGCSHGGASQGRLFRSERAQIYAGGKRDPEQGPVREVQSRMQEGRKREDADLIAEF